MNNTCFQIKRELPDIGPIVFAESLKARRYTITVRPGQAVRVTLPRGGSLERASALVDAKSSWIRKHVERMRAMAERSALLASAVPRVDRAQARGHIRRRVDELAREHSFAYNKIFVRNQKTLWGSCSAKNNINLNANIVYLPGVLMDYVILHELLHTRIKNHSNIFWSELDVFVGNAKALSAEVRKRSLEVK